MEGVRVPVCPCHENVVVGVYCRHRSWLGGGELLDNWDDGHLLLDLWSAGGGIDAICGSYMWQKKEVIYLFNVPVYVMGIFRYGTEDAVCVVYG